PALAALLSVPAQARTRSLWEGFSLCGDGSFTTMALHVRHSALAAHRSGRGVLVAPPRPSAPGPQRFPRPHVRPPTVVGPGVRWGGTHRAGSATQTLEEAACRRDRHREAGVEPAPSALHRCRPAELLRLLHRLSKSQE